MASTEVRELKVFRLETNEMIDKLPWLKSQPTQVRWGAQGQYIVVADWGGRVTLWDLEKERVPHILMNQESPATDVKFSPDGSHAACSFVDGRIAFMEFPDFSKREMFRVSEKPVVGLTWSPDSDEFAYGTREGELGIYHVKERKSRVLYRLEKGRVMDLSWDPLGDRIAVATSTGAVLLVEVASGKATQIHQEIFEGAPVHSVSWSPQGTYLVMGGGRGQLLKWRSSGSEPVVQFFSNGISEPIFDFSWKPGQERVFSAACVNGLVFIFDIEPEEGEGYLKGKMMGHTGATGAVAWHPREQRVASGSRDRTLRIWDPVGQEQLVSLHGHSTPLSALDWGPKGEKLLSAGVDGRVLMWDSSKGRSKESPIEKDRGRESSRKE